MPQEMSAAYELSPQQKQIFAQSQGKSAVGLSVFLQDGIDITRLQACLQVLANRHEILRTSFQRQTGMKFPFQIVRQSAEPVLERLDLSELSDADRRSRVEQLLGDPAQLDPEAGRVLHVIVGDIGKGERLLVLKIAALCGDEKSLAQVITELEMLYSGSEIPEPALQYADYSEWQNEWLRKDDEEARRAKTFWEKVAAESVPALVLPFQRNQAGLHRVESVAVELERGTISRLPPEQSECFLLACWQVLLWRFSGQQKFVLAYECDGRNHDEFTEAIGPFAKSLPLIADLEAAPALADVVSEAERTLGKALEWQDYFSSETADRFTAGFSFRRDPAAAREIARSEFARSLPLIGSRLRLSCVHRESHVEIRLFFDSGFYDRASAQRLAEALAVLCRAAVKHPNQPAASLPITSPSQKRKVLSEFNQTGAEFSGSKCIHQLFEDQAAAHPERPALRFGEELLSYAELNSEANRIAHVLRQHGIGPEVPVALCMERSAEMIVGLLGILKSGGCYVPLISDNPKTRLAHQLSETGSPVMVTLEKHLPQLPEFSGTIFCLDRDRQALRTAPESNPGAQVSPENLAYVIYTSGSTGTPKGVAVRHFNLVNYSEFLCKRLELEREPAGLTFATVSTIGADLGNTCIFPALISGGCLQVIGYELAMSPGLFADQAARHPIDVLKITPSHLQTLMNSDKPGSVLPRKYLVLGGEATTWDLLERIKESGRCAILNHYGPTEATVGCCTFRVDQNDVTTWQPATVPIGKPIANAGVYILDPQLEPVPVGVAGELCVGGTGIARGYLNQPQQTAEKFVPDTFSQDQNARLYRTGDLARFLPDGNIEFLGRIDQQVKIRGFRVEPAETEIVLKRHPAVKQTAIIPYQDQSGERRLAAYLTVGSKIRTEELRNFLAQSLPDYMIPSAFVVVDSLPLTANGKLDVKALPAPDTQQSAREHVAPRTEEEEKMALIWKEVLKLESVGVTDNFFELGGHSLLATQIISRVRNGFRVQIPLQNFLQNPTISALAAQIGQYPTIESEQEEMARLLKELDGISEEEAERLLAAELQNDKTNSGF